MYKNKHLSFFALSLLFLLINGVCIGMDATDQNPATDINATPQSPATPPAANGSQGVPAAPVTTAADAPDADQLAAEIARLKQEAIQSATVLKAANVAIKNQKIEFETLKNNPRVVIQSAEWATFPDAAVPALAKKIETEAAIYERRNSWWGTADNVSERIVYPLGKDVLSFSFNEWRTNEDLRPFGFNIGSGWYKTKLEKANDLATEKKQESDELVIKSGKLDLIAKKQQKENGDIEKQYKEDLNDAQLLNSYINNLVTMCGKAKKKGEFPECDRMYEMAASLQERDLAVLHKRRMAKKEYTPKTEAKS